ncbi:MAG: hypothetical protein R6W06_15315 [Prochlorococcaceae cyanobacterium]
MAQSGNKLIDAATTLVGWINYSATPHQEELTRLSGDAVRISTPLDAAEHFTLLASHPGAAAAVTVLLELAPVLKDGTVGTWVEAATAAIPATGGMVEVPVHGYSLAVAAADAANVALPAFVYARATLSPSTPAGAHVSLTY